jgi:hypothetical protein
MNIEKETIVRFRRKPCNPISLKRTPILNNPISRYAEKKQLMQMMMNMMVNPMYHCRMIPAIMGTSSLVKGDDFQKGTRYECMP